VRRRLRRIDAASVADLYSETAAYLPPGGDIEVRRQKLLDTFTRLFGCARKSNRRLAISFRIVQRRHAYDVSTYTVRSFDAKGGQTSDGKFVVVAGREQGGLWRIQVDAFNHLPTQADESSAR
jgi:ketosteroid isomerase-like protein